MPVLSRGERIRYATVGLIPQEGRRQNRGAELFCRNLKREAEEARERDTRPPERRGPGECANGGERGGAAKGRKEGGEQVGNRTESRRLEVGGSGAEISFYGRVTNLRTRHCRVPADGRTMRLRNTMLHSGNLKAVLTTNLQPPIPPPYVSSPSISQYSLLRHIPIPPRLATAPPVPPSPASVVTFSFFCSYPASRPSAKIPFRRSFLGRSP